MKSMLSPIVDEDHEAGEHSLTLMQFVTSRLAMSRRVTVTLLSVRETAGRMGVTTSTVYALCREQLLSHSRIGVGRGTIRISEEAISEYLTSATVAPKADATVPCPPPVNLKHLRVSR